MKQVPNQIGKMMEALSNIPDEKELENLPEEEKKAKLKELEGLLSGSTSILNTMYDTFRKQELKKLKITFPHLSEIVSDFKKDAYSILKIKYNETIHQVTDKVYDQLRELQDMPDKEKSASLRYMIKKSLLNTREKFRESIEEAKKCTSNEEELIEATEEFYTSYFNMLFQSVEDSYLEQQKKIQDEIRASQKAYEKEVKETVEKEVKENNAQCPEC